MGFSVTVTHAIFFFAALTAGSTAMDMWWGSAQLQNEARQEWTDLSASQVDTNLTLVVDTCDSGCNSPTVPTFRLDVRNSGTTVVDYINLTYVVDGVAHTFANVTDHDIVSPTSISATDLIMPGETMRIELRNIPVSADYTTSSIPVQIVTGDGVIGRR